MADNELYDIDKVLEYQIERFLKGRHPLVSRKELKQVAYVGYLLAQKNFKEDYGKISLLYVSKYVEAELIKFLRAECLYANNVHTDTNMVESIPEEKEDGGNEQLLSVKSALTVLSGDELEVIYNLFLAWSPQTLTGLAKKMNRSKQRIHQIKNKAIEKIKRAVKNEM